MKPGSIRLNLFFRLQFLVGIIFLLGTGIANSGDYEGGRPLEPGITLQPTKTLTVGDPVSAGNGRHFWTQPLLKPDGIMNLGFSLTYLSDMGRMDQGFQPTFWWYPHSNALTDPPEDDGTSLTIIYMSDGSTLTFRRAIDGTYSLAGDVTIDIYTYHDNLPQTKYVLKETNNTLYLQDPVLNLIYIFSFKGTYNQTGKMWRLSHILDRNGNTLTYTYENGTSDVPSTIDDGMGRSLSFTVSDNLIQSVADACERSITFSHEAEGEDNGNFSTLRFMTDAGGNIYTIHYAGMVGGRNNLISQMVFPEENIPYRQTYSSQALDGYTTVRVDGQTDAYDNQTVMSYSNDENAVTVTYADSSTETYKHYSKTGFPKSLTDPKGKTVAFQKSDTEEFTGFTDRMGGQSSIVPHSQTGLPQSMTNAKNQTTGYTYTPLEQTITKPGTEDDVTFTFYNISRIDYPDGTWETFTHDNRGNVLTRTDPSGNTWTHTYNGRGQVLTVTNPAGGITTFTYNNGDATLASVTDSDTGITTYTYDTCKRLIQVLHPDETSIDIVYDSNDRITSIANENGDVFNYEYDGNGNLIQITDPNENSIGYAYDLMDRLTGITNRLDGTVTNRYDNRGRLDRITNPDGVIADYGYDPRGWRTGITTGGKIWQTDYDDEGVAISTTTPLGRGFRYESDALGQIWRVTDPLDHQIAITRDSLNRVIALTDALNLTTNYSYDSRGNLTSVALPDGGQTDYLYNPLGMLTQITDMNDSIWQFDYTNMGRQTGVRDPLNREKTFTYDSRGRLNTITFPDETTAQLTLDCVGNLTRIQFTDGTDLQFGYDSLNLAVTANEVTLTRDAEGHVISTTHGGTVFGATRGGSGRLTNATYDNGSFEVTYIYDNVTGLLSRVSDTLTGTQVDFEYDDDRNLKKIVYPNGEQISYTRDNAGRLTRIQSGNFVDLALEHDAAGRVTKMEMKAPLNPGDFLENTTESVTVDAASQISSAGYAFDNRGRQTLSPDHAFMWDDASRLTGMDGTTLDYNGFGDTLTRTDDAGSRRYHHNHAIGLHPMVSEESVTGETVLRYYVWTPGGELLYMIDAANANRVYFYHYDAAGSTLALTDIDGNLTDAYAYDPYGRLLFHQGQNDQPFTFIGKWGIRRDVSENDIYQMRARYYDAASGRFLSPDPVWPPNPGNSAELNPYIYALNNPVSVIDISGQNGIRYGILSDGTNVDEALRDIRHKVYMLDSEYEWETEGRQLFIQEQQLLARAAFEHGRAMSRSLLRLHAAEQGWDDLPVIPRKAELNPDIYALNEPVFEIEKLLDKAKRVFEDKAKRLNEERIELLGAHGFSEYDGVSTKNGNGFRSTAKSLAQKRLWNGPRGFTEEERKWYREGMGLHPDYDIPLY